MTFKLETFSLMSGGKQERWIKITTTDKYAPNTYLITSYSWDNTITIHDVCCQHNNIMSNIIGLRVPLHMERLHS